MKLESGFGRKKTRIWTASFQSFSCEIPIWTQSRLHSSGERPTLLLKTINNNFSHTSAPDDRCLNFESLAASKYSHVDQTYS